MSDWHDMAADEKADDLQFRLQHMTGEINTALAHIGGRLDSLGREIQQLRKKDRVDG